MISPTEQLAKLPAAPLPATPLAAAPAAQAGVPAGSLPGAIAAGKAPGDKAHAESSKELASALTSLTEALRATPVEVRFSIDGDTHQIVTTVVDKSTGDTIRQFPSEEVLRITRAIDRLQGLLIHQTA
ncbi:flagellar protein FlaG [Cupriavidus basilensis]|uniref:flagellar protein FlaG n=1 Tax=Cupriavidus basilensis TaxID=68895 RepID=UPI00075106B5|nr:flagellar protein FlaG [Cupriavidus basilensis]